MATLAEEPKHPMIDYVIYLLMAATILIYLFFVSGCKNVAYNRVSTDTEISSRNKKVLLGVCDRNFPPLPATFSPGEIIYKTDSFTTIDSFYTMQHDTIVKNITTFKTNTATWTQHDTAYLPNQYHETALNDKVRGLEKEVDRLTNSDEAKSKVIQRMKFKMWLGWIVFFASVVMLVLKKIYLK